jgi:SAM-dependent methyltransferase
MEIIWILIPTILISIFLCLLKPALKGAPFVPTQKSIIRKALKLTNLKPGETLYDLGCGTGRVLVIGAKEFGARVVGFEFSLLLFLISKLNLFFQRVKGNIYCQDFFEAEIRDADVIFLFLTPRILAKLEEKFAKELKSRARIICFSSPLPSWKPSQILPLPERKNKINLYLYDIS